MKKIIIVLTICVMLFLLWQIHPLIIFLLENPNQIDDILKSIFVTGGFGIFLGYNKKKWKVRIMNSHLFCNMVRLRN